MKADFKADVSVLQNSEAFQSRAELIKFMMLQQIKTRPDGLGAWELPVMLSKEGLDVSTATVGRYLKDLDNENLTRKVGNRGRVLTELGRVKLTQIEWDVESNVVHKGVKDAVSGSEYSDLVDIYTVRVAIELGSVKLCCRNATKKEIQAIEDYVNEYESQVQKGNDFTDVSLDFHILLAKGTHNRFMEKLLAMLIFEQKKIEYNLKYLPTRSCGKLFAEQHRMIFNAINEKNEALAVQIMKEHFNDIIASLHKSFSVSPNQEEDILSKLQ